MKNASCKICRRQGMKLFLKGEKCLSPKCPYIKKPYPGGIRKRRRAPALSEFGKELREKQRLRNWYNLNEQQFRNYVKEILEKRSKREKPAAGTKKSKPPEKASDAVTLLIQKLESRFDNIIFRLGFASSRSQARQFISHRHFLINGKPASIPSRQLKKGDRVTIKPTSLKKKMFEHLSTSLKKHSVPSWLELNVGKLEAKVIGKPTLEEAEASVEISAIFEFYSR